MSENMIRYERDDEGIVTLTMDDPGAGANTMNDTYVAAMGETVDRLEAERDDITGVVLASAKKTFFAGGNLTDLQSVTAETAGEFFAGIEGIKSQLRRLEQLGKPVVAALNGATGAMRLAAAWGPHPWSPIVTVERSDAGVDWYVHADGSRSTTEMKWRPDLGRGRPAE